ncbi:MAG: ABC transporter substrate-binding protein [Hydrogenothermaceae bacterium]|nr:ABC transporter substrate-binding protein [Hydrogenothermaceae bacterium]
MSKLEREHLKIGTNFWIGYEIIYLAKELGYLDNTKIVEYNSNAEVLRGLKTGVINAGTLTLDEALRGLNRGMDYRIVLVFDYSNGADSIIAKDYIKKPADLIGKRIGVEDSALGKYMLKRFLEKTGLKREDIIVDYLELNEHVEAFLRSKVDAIITFEPEKSKILKKEGWVIFSSKDIPMEIVDVLVVKTELLDENREDIKKLIDGYYKAFDYFQKNKELAFNMISKRQHITKEEVERAFQEIYLPSKEEVLKSIPQIERSIDKVCNILKEEEIINENLNCNKMFDREMFKELYR